MAVRPRRRRREDRASRRRRRHPPLGPALPQEQRPAAFWLDELEAAGVPAGPINTVAQALADPQIAARGLRIDLPHPLAGTLPLVRMPIRMSDSPPDYNRAPPLLGQHTDEVPRERAGLTDEQLGALRAAGVIA